jgi:hypothetical protein
MRRIDGRCHCGNISYEFLWPGSGSQIPVRACSCSFCIKHGAVYTSHLDSRLTAQISDPALVNQYSFGTKTAEFYVCLGCGAAPFVTSTIEGNVYAVVNVNTFKGVDRTEFVTTVTDFDGESVADRLGRRKRKWIPRVTVETQGA